MCYSSVSPTSMKLSHAMYACGALALFVVVMVVSRMSALWCAVNPTTSPEAGASPSTGTGSSDGPIASDREKQRCYNWLEADLQDCEYVLKWYAIVLCVPNSLIILCANFFRRFCTCLMFRSCLTYRYVSRGAAGCK